MAIEHNFVKGKIVYTDSTHIRANASNSKYENEVVERVIDEDESSLMLVNEKRISKGQKALPPGDAKVETKNMKVSKTDPSSGFMHCKRKPIGFYHLAHGTVDSYHNILLSLHVTPGNVHDSTVYLDNLEDMMHEFELSPKYVGADAGYFGYNILEELATRNLIPVIGPRKYAGKRVRNQSIGLIMMQKKISIHVLRINSYHTILQHAMVMWCIKVTRKYV